ncbi:MAG: hypothetical protein RL318_2392, partial [Fibrobacterota bacterium]
MEETFGKVVQYPDLTLGCDFRLRNSHSQWLNMEGSLTNLRLHPPVAGIVVTMQDVTRFSLAETALREAESKYQKIFENAIEGIFQSTPEGRYLSANPSLAHIYGFDGPQEMIDSIRDISQQIYVDPSRRDLFLELMESTD